MESKTRWGLPALLTLLPAAVGCVLGSALLDWRGESRGFLVTAVTIALVFTAVAMATPVLALYKPFRSYRLLVGVAHSPLSREAALLAVFGMLLLVHWLLALAGVYVSGLAVAAVVVGSIAVLAVSFVYRLGSHPAWRHWSTALFLFGGLLALGLSTVLVAALGWREGVPHEGDGTLAGRVLLVLGALTMAGALGARDRRLRGRRPGDPVSALPPAGFVSLGVESGLLMIGAVFAAASFASAWLVIGAFAFLGAAIFTHWRLFFAGATPLSWRDEAERRAPTLAHERQ